MEPVKKPVLTDEQYNKLKWFLVIALPAIGALYFGLSQIWGLPKAEEVVGTCAIFGTFGGALLGISAKRYNAATDGDMELDPGNPEQPYKLILDTPPADFPGKKELRFKVTEKEPEEH